MNEYGSFAARPTRGTIRQRLLVNALVDPDEARRALPVGLRPHVVDGGTVVGCCLLDIGGIRPAGLPPVFGRPVRAAAHRISVEWETDSGAIEVGVYVPVRHTDSRAARVLGGRWFPGVHRKASIAIGNDGRRLQWAVEPIDRGTDFGVRLVASINSTASAEPCEPVGATCLTAAVGLSLDHRGRLEAARMSTDHRRASVVDVDELDSAFLATFSTAEPAPSYLLRDVDVTWTRARPPRIACVNDRPTPPRRTPVVSRS